MTQELPMDRERLEATTREMMSKASGNLKKDGFVACVIILFMKNGKVVPISVQWEDESHKEHLGRTIRGLASECNYIVIINEIWMMYSEGEICLPVHNHPQRIEGICVSAQAPAGEFQLVYKFKRDRNNAPLEATEAHAMWMEGPPPTPTNFQGLFH